MPAPFYPFRDQSEQGTVWVNKTTVTVHYISKIDVYEGLLGISVSDIKMLEP